LTAAKRLPTRPPRIELSHGRSSRFAPPPNRWLDT
jgi:hypothetical protein